MNLFRRLSQSIRGTGKSLRDYSHFLFSSPEKPKPRKTQKKTPPVKRAPKQPRRKSKKQLAKENKELTQENRRLREGDAKRTTRSQAEGEIGRPSETPASSVGRQRKRYPYLVAGSTNAKSPDNLVATYPTVTIALEKFNELLRGGFNEAMLAVWAVNGHKFELYVGYERKSNAWLQRHI